MARPFKLCKGYTDTNSEFILPNRYRQCRTAEPKQILVGGKAVAGKAVAGKAVAGKAVAGKAVAGCARLCSSSAS